MNSSTLKSGANFPSDLIAVVTGAGSGVGAAVATGLARAGVRVALVGRTAAKLERTQAAIAASGDAAETRIFACDVSQPEQVAALHAAVCSQMGDAQVLVNNAGLHTEFLPIRESTPEKWIETLNVNVVGPYLLTRYFLSGMMVRGWGVINVSSAAGLGAPNNMASIYQLSKVTLNFFTRQLAVEVAGSGVTVNAIHPGEVKTEMWAAIKAEATKRQVSDGGGLRWANMVEETGGDPPEKAADLVLEILSPEYDSVNGQFLWIKNGLSRRRATW
jgi:NAD(P)-dependent dehydrogenase (short-subunit alcohol dehydrogenase family)